MSRQAVTLKRVGPQAGPQTNFAKCSAMEVLFGGAAGGGKSWSLLAEAARYVHIKGYHALLLRRTTPELTRAGSIIDESKEMYEAHADFSETKLRWTFPSGATVSFGHMEREADRKKYQSSQFAYIAFDQVEQFTELQVTYMSQRLRTKAVDPEIGKTVPTRLVLAANPPDDEDDGADWLPGRYAAWLDEMHSNPAKDGEIRWYRMIDGRDTEVPAGTKYAVSRTFIQAKVEDNKILMDLDPMYIIRLENLPEPYRSMYLKGDWVAGKTDTYRVVGAKLIKLAQSRWHPDGHMDADLTAVACDVARGGNRTIIGRRFGNWVEELHEFNTENTMEIVGHLKRLRTDDRAPIVIDVIGVGAGVVDRCKELGMPRIIAFNGAEASTRLDKTGNFGYTNKRAEAHWNTREMLDAELDESDAIALPRDDTEMRAELAAPTWKLQSNGVRIEDKKKIIKRLGRSPDKGDTVMMLLWAGSYVPPAAAVGETEGAKEFQVRRKSGWWDGG